MMQYKQNQMRGIGMRWTMICEMNDMEMNDEMNEMNEMKVTRQICNKLEADFSI